ncbi:MAG: hypothetical protein AAF214_09185 [Pseudomonadota bacterium]
MNANQIINMILKIVMRKAIGKGIDAGVNRATRGRKQQHQAAPHQIDDGYDDAAEPAQNTGPTQAQIRQQRQAKRAARQARQAAKGNGQG